MQGGAGEPGISEEADARAEDALTRFLPTEAPGIVREHHVTALLVAHDGAQWLPRCLAGLASQRRAPERLLAVDAASSDGSGDLLRAQLPGTIAVEDSGVAEALRAATTVGRATAGGVGPAVGPPGGGDAVHWYWILHDDVAPEPGCLEQLLAGADRNPAASVLIPKSVAWADRARLVGIGNMWAPGTPSVERLEPGERDQGQYDIDRPVYCGETAGMLVRAETWHSLDGLDPRYDAWGGGVDFCRRVWGSGGTVDFIPRAVLAHRQAGRLGVRPGADDRPVPRRAARHGQLLLDLTQAPAWALPWRWARGWLSTVVRALGLLLTREPEEAAAELAGAWDALAHPGSVRGGRRALRQPPVTRTSRPAHVRARRGAVLGHALDEWTAARWPGEARPPRRLGRAVAVPLAVAAGLALLSIAREPGLVFGSGVLHGGGLLPATGAGDLAGAYLASWQDVRFGVPTAQPAYLPLLAAASVPVLGSVDLVLRLLLGLAVPLAFLSMHASLGPRFAGPRMLLSLAWALLPPAAAGVSGGRLSTLAVLLLGPPTARQLAAALSAARRPGPRLRPAIAAGTLLGITAAFAPLVLPLTAAAAVVAWLARGMPRWPVRSALTTLVVAACFIALWLPRILAAPWLVLAEVGRNDPALGAPEPWVLGLSPGGPTAVAWAGLPLVVAAALFAVLVRPRIGSLVALAGAAALLAATAWTGPLLGAVWPEVDPATVWPGQMLLVAGGLLALVLARAGAGGGIRAATASAALGGSVLVLGAGWWVAPVTAGVGPGSVLPPVVALAEESPDRSRTLVLARASGTVVYGVSTGGRARLGDADALAAPEGDPAFTRAVEDLVSGVGGDTEAELGRRGIRYVVLDASPEDPLAAVLDASIGLRRLATAPDQSLWLVGGQPRRAELVGRSDDPDVAVPIGTRPSSVDVVLHPETLLPRILLLAERADPGWSGSVDGSGLALSVDGQGMMAAQIAATGRLAMAHSSPWTVLAVGQLITMAVLAVLALPKRRAVDPHREKAP